MAKFPIENLWDPARKCVNIFMVMASLNTFLREAYALERFEFVLEVPLDNTVERKLRRFGRRQKRFTREEFPRWNGIKSLDTTNSEKYQSLALEMAKQLGIPRGQLDVVLF